MKFLLAIILIAVVSLAGTRITFLNRRLPIGIRSILLTGTEYIFLGILLGSNFLNIFDKEALIKLEPLLLFSLTCVGFIFGVQFEIKKLKALPKYYFSISGIQAFVTFLIVSTFIYIIVEFAGFFTEISQSVRIMVSLILGSAASCSAQSALAIVARNFKITNRGLLDLARYITAVDGLFAVILFWLALSIVPGGGISDISIMYTIKWILFSILSGLIPGGIFIFLSRTRFSNSEFLVILIGTLVFCAGLAHKIHHSPLVAGLVFGLVAANGSKHRLRALSNIVHSEKTIYIVLLLIIGASWNFTFSFPVLILTGVYFILRLLGKVSGTFLALKIYPPQYKVSKLFGMSLISEGGLSIAIIVSFKLMYPSVSDSLLSIMLLSVFINELLAPKIILWQFKDDSGESPQLLSDVDDYK